MKKEKKKKFSTYVEVFGNWVRSVLACVRKSSLHSYVASTYSYTHLSSKQYKAYKAQGSPSPLTAK